MTLYAISQEFRQFEESLDQFVEMIQSGELEESAFDDTLEAITLSFEDKADNLACIIKNLLAEIAAMKAEENALQKRRKAKESAAERLKEYLSSAMFTVGQMKLETPRNRISFRKSESVQILDEAQFIAYAQKRGYDDLLTYKDPTVNKTEVKKALSAGVELPGAAVVTNMNIQIK